MGLFINKGLLPTVSDPMPTVRERGIAAGVFVLIILLLGGFGYQWLVQPHQRLNEQLEDVRFRYQKALRLAARQEALERQLQQLQTAQDANNSSLLKEPSASLAAAALQERVKAITSLHAPTKEQCAVRQQKNAPSTDEGAFEQVMITVNMLCSLAALQAILYDLETEAPVLIVNNLIVRKRDRRRNKDTKQPMILEAQFDISGYIKKYTAKASRSAQP